MSFINTFTKRNIEKNKKRTVATIIGVMLSSALICTVAGMAMTFRSSLIQNEIDTNGNFHAQFGNVPYDQLQVIDGNMHVEKSGKLSTVGYAKLPKIVKEKTPYFRVKALDENAFEMAAVILSEGRLPENENEIVIPESLKTRGDVTLKIGDTVEMELGRRIWNNEELDEYSGYVTKEEAEDYIEAVTEEGELSEEELKKLTPEEEHLDIKGNRTYTVVGITSQYSNYISVMDGTAFYTCLTKACGDPSVDCMGKDTVDVEVLYDKPSKTGDYSADIRDVYDKMLNDGIIDTEISYNKTELARYLGSIGGTLLQTLFTFAAIVSVIIIVTSVFVISNSFRISVSDKVSQYGMLSSVGATKKQIRKTVLSEGLYIGVIGTFLGVILGVAVIAILTFIINVILPEEILSLKIVFSFPLWAILITIVLSAITVYFSCIIPAFKASRIPPVVAIKGFDLVKQNLKGKKLKVNPLTKKLFGIGGVIASKNLKRSRKQYRTTTVSLVLGTAIFIGFSYFMTMGFKLVKLQYADIKYNITLYKLDATTEDEVGNIKKQFDKIGKLESVNKLYYYREGAICTSMSKYASNASKDYYEWMNASSDDMPVDVLMMPSEDFKEYLKECGCKEEDSSKAAVLINNTVVFGKTSAYENIDVLNIKEGDVLNCYTKDFETDTYIDSDIPVHISCITDKKPVGYESTYDETACLVVQDDYDMDTADFIYRHAYIVTDDHEKCIEEIDELKENDNSYADFYVVDNTEEAENMHRILLLLSIFLYGFIIVIVLISVTNIFNTITTNMNIRAREFAMLKSVGMTKREFNRMIRLESIMCGGKSLLIGIPIGIILSIFFNKASGSQLMVPYQIPLVPILMTVVAVFIVVGFTMSYSMSKINKQNIIETIRRQNY